MRLNGAAIPKICLRIIFLRFDLAKNGFRAAMYKFGFHVIFFTELCRHFFTQRILHRAIHGQTPFRRRLLTKK